MFHFSVIKTLLYSLACKKKKKKYSATPRKICESKTHRCELISWMYPVRKLKGKTRTSASLREPEHKAAELCPRSCPQQ